jgi:predicted alpha/beta-fold hydrolase
MPGDPITGDELGAQVAAEEAYHVGNGIVPLLPSVKNPTLIVTASNDLINPPSNQARPDARLLY